VRLIGRIGEEIKQRTLKAKLDEMLDKGLLTKRRGTEKSIKFYQQSVFQIKRKC
jgi:DNA-binding HxlR family transcriptional regulator